MTDSLVLRHLDGTAADDDADDLVEAVAFVMDHADDVRRLEVRANADTPEDAARARRFGACGIGLCRTEHMFLGPRRELVERLILAADEAATGGGTGRAAAAAAPGLHRDPARDGRPAGHHPAHRPAAARVPARPHRARGAGGPRGRPRRPGPRATTALLDAVARLHEQNPMLGLRGVRLGIVVPGLVTMQARAVLEAAADRHRGGRRPAAGDHDPAGGDRPRARAGARARSSAVAEAVRSSGASELPVRIGTMIEVPRAALTADRIAASADFFSFGTNDLTQMTWGFSRDDVESAFFPTYLDQGILPVSPFESIDVDGVGSLVRPAARLGRETRPDLHLGVCGEHGGDPQSIHFFEQRRPRLRLVLAVPRPGRPPRGGARPTRLTRTRDRRIAMNAPEPSTTRAGDVRLEPLNRYDCWQLVTEAAGPDGIARVVWSGPDGPAIVPVNFTVADGFLWFQTTPGSRLARECSDQQVLVEVDQVDAGQPHRLERGRDRRRPRACRRPPTPASWAASRSGRSGPRQLLAQGRAGRADRAAAAATRLSLRRASLVDGVPAGGVRVEDGRIAVLVDRRVVVAVERAGLDREREHGGGGGQPGGVEDAPAPLGPGGWREGFRRPPGEDDASIPSGSQAQAESLRARSGRLWP